MKLVRALGAIALLCLCSSLNAQVRRVVVMKLDGVPHDVLERELARVDPVTNKSTLPWISRIFEQGGTRLDNFYVRGISLSTPSWSLLDTGRHLRIRGNAEFDRYTYQIYDYLNFFPFYVGYALSRKVDMPGVEVLDNLGVKLLADRFPPAQTYQSFQLFQRGVRWKTLQHSLQTRFSRPLRQLFDEWMIGFEIGSSIEEQTELELIEKLFDPEIQYLDYFTGDFDHVAHSTADPVSQRQALQRIDALVGRVWTAIEKTPGASQTALIVVSDHGMNSQPGIYSQGYDLVEFFNSRSGGAHHVVTDRHPLTEYKLKGLDPFVSDVITPSEESLYLKKAANQYPTALLDLDGNERASVSLRNSDLNTLHILLDELNRPGTKPEVRQAAIAAFLGLVNRHRAEWQRTVEGLGTELAAVRRRIEQRQSELAAHPAKLTAAERDAGLDRAARRLAVELESWKNQERGYSDYAGALARLLALGAQDFEQRSIRASEYIPRRAMGDANTIRDLQNYVIGPAAGGLAVAADGSLDFSRSFERLNYFPVLARLAVRNNVQQAVGTRPVDFLAMRVPAANLPAEIATDSDAVWLYGDENHQVLLLSRSEAQGKLELRYLPVCGLRQDADGSIHFEAAQIAAGFPLRLFEDDNFAVPENERREWLNSWHSELDWLHAIHKTKYSNGVIGLDEQFLREQRMSETTTDAGVIERFNDRRRRLAEPDFLIFANDHWNFNVRGFNPGGNHGSLLRISTHSVLMLAGGSGTGIPKQMRIEEPYDSLSFVPTVLELMGRTQEAADLPGRAVREVVAVKQQSSQ